MFARNRTEPALIVVFTGLLIAAAGCDARRPDNGTHSSEAEERTLQVTVWGGRFEVFLEHRILTAGQPVSFVTHVTDLESFRPWRTGPVTFVFSPEEKGRPFEEAAPEQRPGIFVASIAFPAAGSWKASLRIPAGDSGESLIDLPRFQVYGSAEEAAGAPPAIAPEGIAFLKEQQWKLLTRTAPVRRRSLTERLLVPAIVTARPGGRAAVAPPVAGRLAAPAGGNLPAPGERVAQGQILGFVEFSEPGFLARAIEAKAEVVRAERAVERAERVLARASSLAGKGAAPQRDLEEAEFALQTARHDLETAKIVRIVYGGSGESAGRSGEPGSGAPPAVPLRSPIGGIVASVEAAPGEYTPADRTIFTILDLSKVHIEGRIAEADLARIPPAPDALYESTHSPGGLVPLAGGAGGSFVLVGQEVDPATRRAAIIYEAPNPEGCLRLGMALTVHIRTKGAEEALVVPASALVDEDRRPVVFVHVAGETFQKRDVTLGIRDGDAIEVRAGIAEGERVVTEGGYAIRLASVSSSIPAHGHVH